MALTLLENDVVRYTLAPYSATDLRLLEDRMRSWMISLREYEKQDGGMSGFANIRFHWYVPRRQASRAYHVQDLTR